MRFGAKAFAASMIVLGVLLLLARAVTESGAMHPRFLVYLGLTALGSVLGLGFRTVSGQVPLTFVFVMAGFAQCSRTETIALALAGSLISALRNHRGRLDVPVLGFHLSTVVLAVDVATFMFQAVERLLPQGGAPSALVLSAPALLLVYTFPQCALQALVERRPMLAPWRAQVMWGLPHILGGSAMAALLVVLQGMPVWQMALILLPLLLAIYSTVGRGLRQLERERNKTKELAGIQMGVLEAVAMALEAREGRTTNHFRRIVHYARTLGRALGLPRQELAALEVASLLHDLGKIAVPEYILTKTAALTHEEFELLRLHPTVGAEILDHAHLPYPVSPLIRAHHENWDGTGYPAGLRGEAIPKGARILRVLDALEAMTTDRRYRRGLSVDDAVKELASCAGTEFDPEVVRVLRLSYHEIEREVHASIHGTAGADRKAASMPTFAQAITAAREEERVLAEWAHLLKRSLDWDGTLLELDRMVAKAVPHDTFALFLRQGEIVEAVYVSGENSRLFRGMQVPLGRGLSGLVAQNGKPVQNGMASADLVFTSDPDQGRNLKCAISVSLGARVEVAGVLTLYASKDGVFTGHHLRLLAGLGPALGAWLETSMRFRQAENRATTDALTGLPNAGALFAHLKSEVARCGRTSMPLTVLVGDLDGFKSVNDQFGHLTGNQVLKLVASGLREHCREYDFVARMGGDEFVLVLPGLDAEALQTRVVRLHQVVREAGISACGEPAIGLSLGAAHFPQDGTTGEDLLACADERMYENKRAARYSQTIGTHARPPVGTQR
jgi:diguanylate cyclase (GGDEF)-like protein